MPDAGYNGHFGAGPRALGAATRCPDGLGVRAGALFLALCCMFHPAASAANNRTQLSQLLLGGSYNPTQPPAQEGLEVRRPKCVMETSSLPFDLLFVVPISLPFLAPSRHFASSFARYLRSPDAPALHAGPGAVCTHQYCRRVNRKRAH